MIISRHMKQQNINWLQFVWIAYFAIGVVSCDFGPGSADYGKVISSDYRLISTSQFQTVIVNVKIGEGIGVEPFGVPANVVEVAWDSRFILAKQQVLRLQGINPRDDYPVPVPGQFNYWIIDITSTNRFGPLSASEFNDKTKKLKIDHLQLKKASRAKKS